MTISAESIVLAAAVVAAVLYLLGLLRKAVHKLDRIDKLTDRELTHNHGSSIKDDVHGMALAIGQLQRDHDTLRRRFDAHLIDRRTRS